MNLWIKTVIRYSGCGYCNRRGDIYLVEESNTAGGRFENLGSEILEKVQNPLKGELSAANPFEAGGQPFSKDLNPFTDVYKNPFE